MKAVIVDDERGARLEIRRLLKPHSDVEIIAEAATANEALSIIEKQGPDLLFLDIQMPEKNGFDLLQAIRSPFPTIIFTTAFDEFAVRAFEVNACDYLLKPISPKRLGDALARARQATGTDGWEVKDEILHEDDQIFLKDNNRCWVIQVRQIRQLQLEENYTRIYFENESALILRSLAALEKRLPDRLFFRANRTQILNLRCIDSVVPWFNNGLKVMLRGGQEVEIARRPAKLFREKLRF
jgi:two-component system, LytTR family, response regulator